MSAPLMALQWRLTTQTNKTSIPERTVTARERPQIVGARTVDTCERKSHAPKRSCAVREKSLVVSEKSFLVREKSFVVGERTRNKGEAMRRGRALLGARREWESLVREERLRGRENPDAAGEKTPALGG